MTILPAFIVVLLLLGIAVHFYSRQSKENKIVFVLALAAKLFAGTALGWIYFSYYEGQGDTISYWHDGKLIAERMLSDPYGAWKFFWDESPDPQYIPEIINPMPRSFFFSKISGILAVLASGNYWVMAGILSFISFLGAWLLFLKTVHFFPSARLPAAIAYLFFPSAVFWSSGLIKESLGLASVFLLSGLLLTTIQHRRIRVWEGIGALLALWMGWSLKYYWMGIFLPLALSSWAVVNIIRYKPKLARFDLPIAAGCFFLLLLIATSIHPNFYPTRFLYVIWESNTEFMALTDTANAVHYHDLHPTWSSVMINAPQALVAGFFRPFLWEAKDIVSGMAGLENMALLILLLTSIPGLRQVPRSPYRSLVVAALLYCIILAVFLALSTPNLGTLSRYKIGFTPFLVFLALYRSPLMPPTPDPLGR